MDYCWFHGQCLLVPHCHIHMETSQQWPHLHPPLSIFLRRIYVNCFVIDNFNQVPNMAPYRSGLPINYIALPQKYDPDLKHQTKSYQSIMGCINWLTTCTHTDVSPALMFLTSYSHAPSHQHYRSTVHKLKYLYSTCNYGISFNSKPLPPSLWQRSVPWCHSPCIRVLLLPYRFSMACLVGWFHNTVSDGTLLKLFK